MWNGAGQNGFVNGFLTVAKDRATYERNFWIGFGFAAFLDGVLAK
jgi:hypothetical protein